MTVTEDNAFLRILRPPDARTFIALERLGPLTVKDVMGLLDVTHFTARRHLNSLVFTQIAESEFDGTKQKVYRLKMSVHDGRTSRERANL